MTSKLVSILTTNQRVYWYLQNVAGKKTRISSARAAMLQQSINSSGRDKEEDEDEDEEEDKDEEEEEEEEEDKEEDVKMKRLSKARRGGGKTIPVFSVAGHAGSGKSHLCETWGDTDVATYDLDYVKDVVAKIREAELAGKKAVIFCGLNVSTALPPKDRFDGIPNVTKIWREVSLDDWIKRGLIRRFTDIPLSDKIKVGQALQWLKEEDRRQSKRPIASNLSFGQRYAIAFERKNALLKSLEKRPAGLSSLSEEDIGRLVWKFQEAWENGYTSSIDALVRGAGRDRKENHVAMGYVVVPESKVAAVIRSSLAATAA